eukprot:TRINITY_DN1353_c0_g2_i3.p1 TRINITY_DN1353_c0_g2~~TRINITY_DN1353_c0_g2_i3.p1  ORF type:complete len:129 (-),score=32.48 TRINITY_DN1353_c0_g2_i3:91-477(-)
MYAFTTIPGVGRRFSNLALKKAEIDLNKRAGELTKEEIQKVLDILEDPEKFDIPLWFLNRQKDYKTGVFKQNVSNELDIALREDILRLKKIRAHRGLRHYWRLRVRGQHTKTTGRSGRTVGVSRTKGL